MLEPIPFVGYIEIDEMNNKPVAWIDKNTGKPKMEGFIQTDHDIPLYTHPTEHDLGIAEAIGFDKGYKAGKPADLTDEEILEIGREMFESPRWPSTALDFARAILRKASEK